MRKVALLLVSLLIFSVFSAGCSGRKSAETPTKLAVSSEKKTMVITDLVGREVKVKVPVERVVLLYGLEDYAPIGGEEALKKLVGINAWRYKKWRPDWWQYWVRNYPKMKDLPDVGQPGENFKAEEVIKLKPDVVIAAAFMYKYMQEDVKRFEEAGIPIVFTDYIPHSDNVSELFEEAEKSTMILGKLLGKENRAKKLMEFFKDQFNIVLSRAKNIKNKPKVIVFGTWSQWMASGKKDKYNFWIKLAGGKNIAENVISGHSGDVNPEFVLRENPDVIIFTCNNNFPSGQKVAIGYTVNDPSIAKEALKELINRPGWGNLKAVNDKRVYLIHHGISHGHIFEFACLQYIAKWLHPELFKDLNPEENLKEFYNKFMPYPLKGIWAVELK